MYPSSWNRNEFETNYEHALLLIQTLAGRLPPLAIEAALEEWEARCAERISRGPVWREPDPLL